MFYADYFEVDNTDEKLLLLSKNKFSLETIRSHHINNIMHDTTRVA
jgi:hypothetical protein